MSQDSSWVVSTTVAQRQEYLSVWSPTAMCSFSLNTLLSSAFKKPMSWNPFPVWILPLIASFSVRIGIHPIPKGSTENLLKPGWGWWTHLCFAAPCHSLLGHFCSFFVSYSPLPYHLWTRATVPSPSSLSAQTSCSFKNLRSPSESLGHPVLIWCLPEYLSCLMPPGCVSSFLYTYRVLPITSA